MLQNPSRSRSRIRHRNVDSNSRSVSCSANSLDESDRVGLIELKKGDTLQNGRYKILGLAGQGTFGTVLDAVDTKHNDRVAIKVVRSVPRYLDAAELEVDILQKLKVADVNRQSLCVRLFSKFDHWAAGKRHVCISFEKLGVSLYEFIKKNNYRGFSLPMVKLFGFQLLTAVAFCHKNRLVHTDLKPENILLVHSKYSLQERKGRTDYRVPLSTSIRLIDFGGATFENEHHSRIVNTRQYRGPEILLGLGWAYPSDIWSVGCILVELFTGDYLFGTHEDMEHLAMMEKILERKIPESMTSRALERNRQKSKSKSSRSRHSSTSSSSSLSGRSSRRTRDKESKFAKKSDTASEREYLYGRAYNHHCPYGHGKAVICSRSSSSDKERGRSGSLPPPDVLLHTSDGCLRWPEKASSRSSTRRVARAKTLPQLTDDADFLSLLQKLLRFNPSTRITAQGALQHPFFDSVRNQFPSSSSSSSSSSGAASWSSPPPSAKFVSASAASVSSSACKTHTSKHPKHPKSAVKHRTSKRVYAAKRTSTTSSPIPIPELISSRKSKVKLVAKVKPSDRSIRHSKRRLHVERVASNPKKKAKRRQ